MFTTIEIGGVEYKLRLTTRQSIALEKALGYNPISMLMEMDNDVMPKLGEVLIILHSMLQPLQHGITMDKVYEIFDEYVADGHSMFDLIPYFIEVFKQSGYITDAAEGASADVEENAKN